MANICPRLPITISHHHPSTIFGVRAPVPIHATRQASQQAISTVRLQLAVRPCDAMPSPARASHTLPHAKTTASATPSLLLALPNHRRNLSVHRLCLWARKPPAYHGLLLLQCSSTPARDSMKPHQLCCTIDARGQDKQSPCGTPRWILQAPRQASHRVPPRFLCRFSSPWTDVPAYGLIKAPASSPEAGPQPTCALFPLARLTLLPDHRATIRPIASRLPTLARRHPCHCAGPQDSREQCRCLSSTIAIFSRSDRPRPVESKSFRDVSLPWQRNFNHGRKGQ